MRYTMEVIEIFGIHKIGSNKRWNPEVDHANNLPKAKNFDTNPPSRDAQADPG